MTIEPNIFEFATSELSQDAFLCYLLYFGKSKYKDTKEYELARLFLTELGVNEDVEQIKRQESHIDVLILTKSYALILEDKTFSIEHSKQLKRYLERCKKDYPNKNVKLLYFKTEYTSIQEKEELKKYEAELKTKIDIFDIDKITNIIKTYSGENIIVNMWAEKIKITYDNIKNAEDKIKDTNDPTTYARMVGETQQDVYLDQLTYKLKEDFKKDFKGVYWYRAAQGRTPHICLNDTYIEYDAEQYEIHFGIYIMFRKEPWIIVKEHLYNKGHKYRFKLYEKEYSEYKDELNRLKNKLQQAITKDSWEKKNEDKDKLIILKKKVNNIANDIEGIKELQEIINNIKNLS